MKAKDARIMWSPNHDYIPEEMRGKIRIYEDDIELKKNSNAHWIGHGDSRWDAAKDKKKCLNLLFKFFLFLTVSDKMDPDVVHKAFLGIDEYKARFGGELRI